LSGSTESGDGGSGGKRGKGGRKEEEENKEEQKKGGDRDADETAEENLPPSGCGQGTQTERQSYWLW